MKLDPNLCPKEIQESVARYILDRTQPGGFLTAVLSNDLFGAINKADLANLALLPHIALYVTEHVPHRAYGCSQWVTDWVEGLT